MREFETTFIVQPEISEEGCQAICERLDTILERGGGIRLLYDDDGKRKLAYEIDNFQKGRYFCLHYFDEGKTVPEIERSLRLDESILRFLTVRVADEVEDIEGRKEAAAIEEKERAARAAERAAREAEERAAREEEERLAREAAAAQAAAAAEDEEGDEESAESSQAEDGAAEEANENQGGEAAEETEQ